jgi:peroxiredoxin
MGAALATSALGLRAAAKVPRPAPEYVISLNGGEQLVLSKYRGKVVILEMLLTTCPHCKKCAQAVQTVMNEYAAKGVVALGSAVNDGAKNELLMFSMQTGAKFPIGVTDRMAAYKFLEADMNAGPVYFPQLVFIDRQGVIRGQFGAGSEEWFFKDEEKNIKAKLDELLRGATK